MITCKIIGSWPRNDEAPVEVYVYIYRGKTGLDRVVISQKKISFDIDISFTPEEMPQFIEVLKQFNK